MLAASIVRLTSQVGPERNRMLYTIVMVLLALWVLGMVMSFAMGGMIHLLLGVAVVLLVWKLSFGPRRA